MQTVIRAAQNNSSLKGSLVELRPSAPGRGSLVLPACTLQLACLKRCLLEDQHTALLRRFLYHKPPTGTAVLFASAVASRLKGLSGAARPSRKGTGPGVAPLELFVRPCGATQAQLAGLSFLNHSTFTKIESLSSCAGLRDHFSVGLGLQRTPSTKIAPIFVLD